MVSDTRNTPHLFTVGPRSGDHLEVQILARSHPESEDFCDGNWIGAAVGVVAGGFSGKTQMCLRSDELQAFFNGLQKLDKTLKGEATFRAVEDQLDLTVKGNGRGHLYVSGKMMEMSGNTLSFRMEFDQTELPPLLKGLSGVLQSYPVVGSR